MPFIDRLRPLIDLREQVVSFPPQPVITEDNLVVNIDTVIYFQVTDPKSATYEIANYIQAIEQLTVTTLRNVIGGMALEKTLTSRDEINGQLRGVLDEATGKWGIRVNRVELKAIDPPASIKDSMEKQMRADREKRATILQAEGQKQSAILTAEGEKQAGDPPRGGPAAGDDPRGGGPGEGDRHRLQGDPRGQPRPAAARLPVPPGAAADRAGRVEQGLDHPGRVPAGARAHRREGRQGRGLETHLRAPGGGVLAERGSAAGRGDAEIGRCLGERRHRPDAHVLASNTRSHSSSGRRRKSAASSDASGSWSASYCRSASSGRPSTSQRRAKNFGSSAATVSQRPSAVSYIR